MNSVSCIIPSRGRPAKLARLLSSIWKKADGPIGIWVGVDDDDPTLGEYKTLTAPYFRSLIAAPRRKLLQEYYNVLAARSTGDILFVLNDDVVIETRGFDTIMKNAATDFPIALLEVNDSTRDFGGNGKYPCFPAVTRDVVDCLGHMFNPRFPISSDKWLKETFVKAGAKIIDLTDKIMVSHDHLRDDDTHKELQQQLEQRTDREPSHWMKYLDEDADKLMKARYAIIQ